MANVLLSRASSLRAFTLRVWAATMSAVLVALPVMAQSAVDVDLASSHRDNTAHQTGQVNVGGNMRHIKPGDMVTDAELAAVRQAAVGTQTLILDAHGSAIGGQINLTHDIQANIHNLIIPTGVTAVQDFGVRDVLQVGGKFNNTGSVLGISTNAAVTQAVINANSVLNGAGGLMATTGTLSGFSGLVQNLNLTFNVVNDFINQGAVASAGALNITAGGAIKNMMAPGSAVAPTMTAALGMNLAASSIVNQGTMQALAGNINFVCPTDANFFLNNIGGRIEALNGLINVRDTSFGFKKDLQILGGDLFAQSVNLFSGDGVVDLNLEELSGRLNIRGGIAHVCVSSDNLTLGDIILTGDPTFYNTQGNVTIDGTLYFPGQPLALVAGGDIIAGANAFGGFVATDAVAGNSGNLTMIAGAAFTSTGPAFVLTNGPGDSTSTIRITGASTIGGKIDFNGLSSVSASNFAGTGNAGDVTIVAFGGTNPDSGTVSFPNGIGALATGTFAAGDITIMAGGTSTGTSILSNNIANTTGAGGTAGNVYIATRQAQVGSGVTILDGAITGGSFTPGALKTGSIIIGSVAGGIASSGGSVTIDSGHELLISNISNNAVTGAAGSIFVSTSASSLLRVGTTTGTNYVGSASATAVSGNGANLTFINSGSGGIAVSAALNANANVAGSGGNIVIDATASGGTGSLSFSGAGLNINANGANGGGGTITLSSTNAIASTASFVLLNAFATGNGNGGTLSVTTTSPAADILGQIAAANNLAGNVRGAGFGNGGTVVLDAGRDIKLSNGFFLNNPQGSGSGGNWDLNAGNNISINGTLSANANGGVGNGGFINIFSNSSSPFIIAAAATPTNGITGAITAGGFVDGGSIYIGNRGTGGIAHTINQNNLAAVAIAGNGGSMTLDAVQNGGSGPVTLGDNFVVSVTGFKNGGNLTVRGSQVLPVGAAPALLADAGVGGGIGGTVTLESSDPSSNVLIGNSIGNIRFFARGTGAGGNGGTINITSGKDIVMIANTALQAQPAGAGASGNGGHYNLTAGRNVNLATSFNANAVVSGNGGSIAIDTHSTSAFAVGVSGSPNGVFGSLSAQAVGSGDGGTISIKNSGTGGIQHNFNPGNINVSAVGNGKGGAIVLDALSDGGSGNVLIGSGYTLAANAAGTGAKGGDIVLRGVLVDTGAAGATFQANGSTNGAGGTVTFEQTDALTDLVVGAGSDIVSVDVRGGTTAGDGGQIDIKNGRDVTVDTAALLFAPPAAGSGGKIALRAGRNLDINNGLNASAVVDGRGGTIDLTSNSATVFTLNGGAVNRVNGLLTANGVGNGGQGTISVANNGTGGITGTGIHSANGAGTSAGPTGSISLTGATVNGNMTFNINGGANGQGGTINVSATGATSDIFVALGNITANAQGGTTSGGGGTIHVSAGRDIGINPANAVVAPTSGDGGHFNFEAGRNLQIIGLLSASAIGTGNGGSINISTNSSLPFRLSGGTANGSTSAFTASAATAGNGGSIAIANNGSGGIVHQNATNAIQINAAGSGNGGSATLNAGSGQLFIGAGGVGFPIDASGAVGGGSGGSIGLAASEIVIGPGGAPLLATGFGTNPGGTVTITSTDSAADLTIGFGGAIPINIGGASAGTVNLSSGHNLVVYGAALIATATAGNGANINLTAGTSAITGVIQVLGTLNANAVGNGIGGNVSFTYKDPANPFVIGSIGAGSMVSTAVNANGAGTGNGGVITFTNSAGGASPLSLQVAAAALTATGVFQGQLNLNGTASTPVSVTAAGSLPATMGVSGASFSFSGTGGSIFAFNSVQTVGAINISASTGTVRVTSGSILDAGTSATVLAVNVFNGGTISAGNGSIQLGGSIATWTLNGLGHLTAAQQIAMNATNTVNISGSQTYDAGTSVTIAAPNVTFNEGTAQTILTNTPFSVSANNLNLNKDMLIDGSAMTSAQMSLLQFSGIGQTITLNDGVTANLVTGGGPILIQSPSLGFSNVGFTMATLSMTGGPVTITGNTAVNVAGTVTVSAGSTITINTASLLHNGIIQSFASGNAITVQNLSGNLALTGSGFFQQFNSLGTAHFTANGIMTFASGMNYLIQAPFSGPMNATFSANEFRLPGNGSFSSVSLADGILNMTSTDGTIDYTLTGAAPGTLNLNVTSGSVTTTGANVNIAAGVTVTTGKPLTFNIPGGGTFTNNGTVSSGIGTGNGITVTSPGALTVAGSGNYFNSGTAITVIDAGGNLTLTGTLIANTDLTLQTTGTAFIDGTGGTISSPGNDLVVTAGSGMVQLSTNVGTLTLTGTGTFDIDNAANLTLLSLTGTAAGLNLDATGTLAINGAVSADAVVLSSTGNMTLNQNVTGNDSVDLLVTGASSISGTGVITTDLLTVTAGAGGATLTAFASGFGVTSTGIVTVNAGGDLTVLQASTATLLSINSMTGDDIFLNAPITVTNHVILATSGTGTITGSGLVTAPGNLQLTLGAGSATVASNAGVLIVASAGSVSVTEVDAIVLNNITATALTVSATAITNSAPVNVTGVVTLQTPLFTNNNVVNSATTNVSSANALTLAGTGSFGSTFSTNLTAGTSALTLNGSQTFNGTLNLNAVNAGQSVIVSTGANYQGGSTVNVNTPFLLLQGTLTGNPLRLNSALGAGTIANNAGDLTLPGSLTFLGQNLAILASGNVQAAATAKFINLSSATLAGGSLTIVAGYDFTPQGNPLAPASGVFTLGSPSASGGSVMLPLVAVNTSAAATNKAAGNVTIIAHAGAQNGGVVSIGGITTTAAVTGIGGKVLLIGQGGVQVGAGGITTRASRAGDVVISGSTPQILGGSISIINGASISSGAFVPSAPTLGAGAAVLVAGPILTNALAGRGGDVAITADSQIEIVGNILTSGFTQGGAVTLASTDSFVSIGTNGIKTSGVPVVSGATAGAAGAINIIAPGGVTSLGSLLAQGGLNTGAGDGGNGSAISIQTTNNNPGNLFINTIRIVGVVSTQGGNATGGGDGGAGGDITFDSGVLQVTGAGNSIISSAGTGGTPGAHGDIDIVTYASQTIPAIFDLTTAVNSLPALPGGMFTVGTPNPVNGVAGQVVAGGTVASKLTVNGGSGRIVASNPFNQGQIDLAVTGGQQTITENAVGVPILVDNGAGIRTLVSPSEAVALMQKSLTGAQTIVLNATGQTMPGSVITAQSFELPQQFTLFNFKSFGAPIQNVQFNVTGLRPVVKLPAAGVQFGGTLNFTTAGSTAMVDFGTGAMLLQANSAIKGTATTTLLLSGTGSLWTNNGLIEAGDIVIAHPTTSPFTFTLGAGGVIQGALGAVSPAIILSASYMPSYSVNFKANGATFGLPVEFADLAVPTIYKASAQKNASTFATLRPVLLTFALTNPLNAATTAVVQGTTAKVSTLSVKTLPNTVAGITTQTPLSVATNAVLTASTTFLLSSVAGLSIGNNVALSAGVLKSTAPVTGLLAPTDITAIGSIALTATGAAGITVGSNGSMVVAGGNLTTTSTTGGLTMANSGLYQSNGGRIVMLAKGAIVGGTGNTFYARGTNVKSSIGGGIEIGSGLISSSNLSAAFALPKGTAPVPAVLGTNVVINNSGGTKGTVRAITSGGGFLNLSSSGSNTATLNLTGGGAVVFDAVNTGALVQFDGGTFKTESLKPIAYYQPAAVATGDADGAAAHDRQSGGQAIAHVYTEDADDVMVLTANANSAAVSAKQQGAMPVVTLKRGAVVMRMLQKATIASRHAQVQVRKGALVSMDLSGGVLRVVALSGPGDVTIVAAGRKLDLPPGREAVIAAGALEPDELKPEDGIGRRDVTSHELADGLALAVSEVSLTSLITSAPHFHAIKKPASAMTRNLQEQMLKTAAALHHLGLARGSFSGRSKPHRERQGNSVYRQVGNIE